MLIGPITTVYYDSGFLVSLKGFVGAIIGGLVSYPLAAAGALLVGLLEAFSSFWASALQGSDRVHADHPGAAVAQPHDASSARRKSERGPGRDGGRMSRGARLPLGAWGYAIFVAALVGVPLVAPQFWVTLGNYIGLYSIVALGLVLLTGVAGQTSFGQAAFVGHRRVHDGDPRDAIRLVAVGRTLRSGSRSPSRSRCSSASSRCG